MMNKSLLYQLIFLLVVFWIILPFVNRYVIKREVAPTESFVLFYETEFYDVIKSYDTDVGAIYIKFTGKYMEYSFGEIANKNIDFNDFASVGDTLIKAKFADSFIVKKNNRSEQRFYFYTDYFKSGEAPN